MRVSLIQLAADVDLEANLAQARDLAERAIAADRPDLVVLPETFTLIGGDAATRAAAAEAIPDGPASQMLREVARRHAITVHGGSFLEKGPDSRAYNSTIVVGPDGEIVTRYRKIHLFDVTAPDGRTFRESDGIAPGTELATYELGGFRLGCTICYDLRFPELFQLLARQGAEVFLVPSAFTQQTGKDHWEVLLRARAIENGAYVLAPDQSGPHPTSRRTSWGHSMVVDPWGSVIAQASDGPGWVTARLDHDRVVQARRMIPTHRHHRLIDPWDA
jgi:deaminated glutathione amidase